MQKITLAPGEVLVIDFGAPEPARRWTGTLRTTGGDAVRGGGKMHLFRTDTNAYSTAKIEEDGTFVVLLPAGKYSVGANLNTNWAVRVRFPSIELGSVDLSQDLTLPGTRVHGVVIDESTGQPVGPEFKLGIGVRMRGANNSGSSAKLDAEGRFVVDGIEPGVWLVSSWPLKLVEGDHEIVVNKQDVEIPLRLTVKTRK